jgi:hypothetical protein
VILLEDLDEVWEETMDVCILKPNAENNHAEEKDEMRRGREEKWKCGDMMKKIMRSHTEVASAEKGG